MPTIWELDFYSRPILDDNQKKIWEVLVCESPLDMNAKPAELFRYSEYCANAEVNSVRLKQALAAAIALAPQPPDKIRFFRQAMTNMIVKACEELGIAASLSRRTYALSQWLQERTETVYPQEPGFQAGSNPSVSFATTPPQPLPDALVGQKWAFVTLEAAAFEDMGEWAIDFGESFPLSLIGLSPEARVPGLVVYSSRAIPLAAWMSGLELAYLKFEPDPPQLLLESGVSDRWILANLPNATVQTEAATFTAAKAEAQGVHFLAVQSSPDTEAFAGFWLLQETKLA